jgi:hypothetical protein
VIENGPLLPFEDEHFHGAFKSYIRAKREGAFNTIEAFPEIWKGFELLDGRWSQSLANLTPTNDQKRILPALLFFNAHARIRIAFELGFSRCFPEALGTLRSAIESAAYGYQFTFRPYEFPKLTPPSVPGVTPNLDQERNKLSRQIKTAFNNRKQRLFEPARDLGQLSKLWEKCSERGSHLTFQALSLRAMRQLDNGNATGRHLIFHYSDAPREVAQALLTLFLDCGYAMHVVFYKAFESRLKLDPNLPQSCGEFVRLREKLVLQLKASASVKP